MRVIAILLALAVAAVVELMLLDRIARGSVQPAEAFLYMLIWAAGPFLWEVLVIAAAIIWRRSIKRLTAPLLFVSAVGPALACVALAVEYDHSEPFLVAGFLLQCFGAFVATILVAVPPNPSIQSGRAQARAADFRR